MRIRRDLIQIHNRPTDLGGAKIEPEAQPARRIIESSAPVGIAPGPGQARTPVGAIPLNVTAQLDGAGAYANMLRGKCGNCKFFDRAAWRAIARHWETNSQYADERQFINSLRQHLLMNQTPELSLKYSGADDDFDVDAAIMDMGLCQIFTEMRSSPVAVPPYAVCPETFEQGPLSTRVVTPERPMGFFEPKDPRAARAGTQAYDRIMRIAMGADPGDR